MNDSESYLVQCIRSLPPEKQEAARRAFRDISETGEDNLISKLLVVLEATGAHAKTVPQELARNGEQFLQNLNALLAKQSHQQAADEKARDAQIRAILAEQLPAMSREMSVDKLSSAFQAQNTLLGRMERGISRLRHMRIGGIIIFLLFGILLGVGGITEYYYKQYQDGQHALAYLNALASYGISVEAQKTDTAIVIDVHGPEVMRGTAWTNDDQGHTVGAKMLFSKEQHE